MNFADASRHESASDSAPYTDSGRSCRGSHRSSGLVRARASGTRGGFDQAVNTALDLLEDEIVPLAAMLGKARAKEAKRLVLSRFPYSIVVRQFPDEIVVVAIAHQSRRPGYWRSRLRP
jgi:hypothetical protein